MARIASRLPLADPERMYFSVAAPQHIFDCRRCYSCCCQPSPNNVRQSYHQYRYHGRESRAST